MTDLWSLCRERLAPFPLSGDLVRVVESQEQVATTALVDDLAEQALLEDLIEGTKPARAPGTEGLHYLLATPFRYPPLAHGSRFGNRFEPSIFYASRRLDTALAETAYYRFVFWSGMRRPPPGGRFLTQHTAFGAGYRTDRGIRLQAPPCDAHTPRISDPEDYTDSRLLGTALREVDIKAFEFRSARDPGGGINVGLFTPEALSGRRPRYQQSWLCETRLDAVRFSSQGNTDMPQFGLETFLVNGHLPVPAFH